MDEHTKKLIDALQTIKDVCVEYSAKKMCEECPFCDMNGECGVVDDLPKTWNIEPKMITKLL